MTDDLAARLCLASHRVSSGARWCWLLVVDFAFEAFPGGLAAGGGARGAVGASGPHGVAGDEPAPEDAP